MRTPVALRMAGMWLVAALAAAAWAQDDHGDSAETATLLAVGPPEIGTIDGADDVDYYRIDLAGSATVTVATAGPTDTRGELLDGSGALIASDEDSGPGAGNFQLTEALEAGVYYVAVSGSEGGYALTALLADAGDQGGTAASSSLLSLYGAAEVASVTSIASSALLSTVGTIDEAMADLDYFRIDVPRDGTDVVLRTPGTLDTAGRLLDSSLAEVASDEGGDGAFRIETTLDAGTYYLEVSGHEAGRYRVVASGSDADCACAEEAMAMGDHGGTAETSTLMAIGPPLTGAIGDADDVDVFRIDLAGNATVALSAAGPTDTRGVLRNGALEELASADAGGPGMNFGITEELVPGVYYLEVSGAAAGNYSVSALIGGDADHGDTAGQSTLLTLYSEDDLASVPQAFLSTVGNIDAAETDLDVFRLDVPQDMTDVTIRSLGTLDTFATLRDASLRETAMDDGDGAFRIEMTLDAGTYYVEVRGHDAGRYRVLAWGDLLEPCNCVEVGEGQDSYPGDGTIPNKPRDDDLDGDGVANAGDAFPLDPTRSEPEQGISTTLNGQVLVEITPDELGPSNLFDLEGKSITFTPDAAGRYALEVEPLAWESDLGDKLRSDLVQIESFRFPFGGEWHGSFHVSSKGVLTFGAPMQRLDALPRFGRMSAFITSLSSGPPAVSAFYKPFAFGTQHARQWADRVVVTWVLQVEGFWVFGLPPERDDIFQAVLFSDGRVRLSYQHMANKDAIVGLFHPNTQPVVRGALVATLGDGANPEIPDHVDIVEVNVFATNTDALIVDFVLRGPLRPVPVGSTDRYYIAFDTVPPLDGFIARDEGGFSWAIDREASGVWTLGNARVLDVDEDGGRLSLLGHVDDFAGGDVGLDVAALEFREGTRVHRIMSPGKVVSLTARSTDDLSVVAEGLTRPYEIFHWPTGPNTVELTCRIIDVVGDVFDFLAFHGEFRIDVQESGSDFVPWVVPATGIGLGRTITHWSDCSAGRLKGHFGNSVWAKSVYMYQGERGRYPGFTLGSWLFAHEMGHTWGTYLSSVLPLDDFGVHWHRNLHSPAAFPWDEKSDGSSTMGGRLWMDNGNGTFSSTVNGIGGGFSWLDLYLMGLADPNEVPDTFVLRKLKRAAGQNTYTAEREAVALTQIIAAEGTREPAFPQTQSTFNAAFVYMPTLGEPPDADLLELHSRHVEHAVEYWSHITGSRSSLTTELTREVHSAFEPRRRLEKSLRTRQLWYGHDVMDLPPRSQGRHIHSPTSVRK